MAKDKKHISDRQQAKWRSADIFLQLAIVIAGILVTFQGTAWINRTAQKREVRKILVMVEDELRQNLEELETGRKLVEEELTGMDFFARHMYDIYLAPLDSVKLYYKVLDSGPAFGYSSNALEVLKASTASINVMDKELLMEVFICYDKIDKAVSSLNYYYTNKFKMVGEFYFSTDREVIVQMTRNENPYPYIEKYLENVATGNLVLNAEVNLKSKMKILEETRLRFIETIAAIENYTDGKRNGQSKRKSSGRAVDSVDIDSVVVDSVFIDNALI